MENFYCNSKLILCNLTDYTFACSSLTFLLFYAFKEIHRIPGYLTTFLLYYTTVR